MLEHALRDAQRLADRRDVLCAAMNHQRLNCPACDTRQVQLVAYFDPAVPARWKCRHCKTAFSWEPDAPPGESAAPEQT